MSASPALRRLATGALTMLLLVQRPGGAAAEDVAADAGQAVVPAPPVRNSPWRLTLAGAASPYFELRETGRYTPVPNLDSAVSEPWQIEWKQRAAWFALSRDIARSEQRTLCAGLLLGTTVGTFRAGNDEAQFSESWRTKPALLWGISLEGELRSAADRGPFLRLDGNYARAAAGEDRETLSSSQPGVSGDDRDARFSWHQAEVSASLGWRWRRLAGFAGVSYREFSLHKEIRFQIPIPASAATDDPVAEVPRRLNAEESTFDYRNRDPWSPHAGLEWLISERWTLAARGTFSGVPAYGLAAGLRF